MDAIEKRARELLAAEYKDRGSLVNAMNIEMGGQTYAAELAAIIAALTPPEGYVLVQETQLRHLLNDAITSVEFIAGRGQSKPLSRRVRDQAWALVESIPARRNGAVMARSSDHVCEQAGWPSPNTQNASLTLALRMVARYGHRVPSVETLRADFGVSRATAYRWRRAFVDAVQGTSVAEVSQ